MRRRKSPYKHKVREHTRQGRPVGQYERGKGRKTHQIMMRRKSRVVGNNPVGRIKTYDVSIFYVGEGRETFPVEAKNYDGALMAAPEMRDKSLPPKLIRIRRTRQ